MTAPAPVEPAVEATGGASAPVDPAAETVVTAEAAE